VTIEGCEPGRVAARLAKQVELALAEAELSLPQYRVLLYLARGSEMASNLAGRLDVSRPTVTAIVDGLVARGLVDRIADPRDRRRVRHELTAEGKSALASGDRAVHDRLHRLAGHLSQAQARRAFEGLALWEQALDRDRRAAASATDRKAVPAR
jgi:long-chain acyl-CoA synthetase